MVAVQGVLHNLLCLQIKGRGRQNDCPSQKELNDCVVKAVAVKWRNLGFQLLNNESVQHTLDIIKEDHTGKVNIIIHTMMQKGHAGTLYNIAICTNCILICCYELVGCHEVLSGNVC